MPSPTPDEAPVIRNPMNFAMAGDRGLFHLRDPPFDFGGAIAAEIDVAAIGLERGFGFAVVFAGDAEVQMDEGVGGVDA